MADRAEVPSRPAGVVIPVSEVLPATDPLPEVSYATAVEALLMPPSHPWGRQPDRRPDRPVAACSQYHGHLAPRVEYHPVVAATTIAFSDHRMLTLSPDMIWLLIAQGFANHVNANAEKLRPRLVRHPGTLELWVRRDDFEKNSPTNPWPEVFEAFTRQIGAHIGEEAQALLRPTFSTTGPAERAAADIVLLDAMQSYFEYTLYTFCGIPAIALEGTVTDWRSLASRARDLAAFDLGWWIDALVPILDEFVEAASGRVDREFWKSICRVNGQSGGPFTDGWIMAFFPYLKGHDGMATVQNEWLLEPRLRRAHILSPWAERGPDASGGITVGPRSDAFPGGLSRVPFRWEYGFESHPMEFLGGFVGVRQDHATLALRPEIGWAVRPASCAF